MDMRFLGRCSGERSAAGIAAAAAAAVYEDDIIYATPIKCGSKPLFSSLDYAYHTEMH
jgi:hypothetical protein